MYKHLNHVGNFPFIPDQAFLFCPHNSNDPNAPDDFKRHEGKVYRRLLFQGWAQKTYIPNELQKLKSFEDYLKSRGIQLGQCWDNPLRLRFLISTEYQFDIAVEQMKAFNGYINRVRDLHLTTNVSKNLHQGFFYIVGRDSHYRPIVVIDAQKIIKANLTEQQSRETQIYFFQYLMKNYFIPGQVQSWITIIDSAYLSFFSLTNSLQNAFKFLAQTYRMRLYCCYNVRINFAIKVVWGIVQKFLDDETINKIILVQDSVPQGLFQYTNRSQVQEKFGGTMPNIKEGHFWPPPFEVSKDYKVQKEKIRHMTRQQYTQNYEKKVLYDTKISQDLLLVPQRAQIRDNHQKRTLKNIEREIQRQWQEAIEQNLDLTQVLTKLKEWEKPVNYADLAKKQVFNKLHDNLQS